MKYAKIHIIGLLALFLFMAGCSHDGNRYPSVQLEYVTALTNAAGKVAQFTTDKGRMYKVTGDQTATAYNATQTVRIVANYELQVEGNDTTAYIYASTAAVAAVPQTADKFKNGVKTDPSSVISVWMGRNYLNIVLGILSQSKQHDLSFVQQSVTIGSDGRRRITILLYHNNNGDVQAYTKRAYLSIPLSQYAGDDKKGAIISFTLNTDSGLKTYSFDYSPQ